MHLHINHMYCTQPCWEMEGMYCCSYGITIQKIGKDKSYYDEPEKDWSNLTAQGKFFDEEEYNKLVEFESTKEIPKERLKVWAMKSFPKLKDEVIEWLNENVKDSKEGKGWCCGDESYLATNPLSIHIFFTERRML